MRLTWNRVRDVLLVLGGLGYAGHEILQSAPADPAVLFFCGAMMGLPAFLKRDGDS
jgi:hypothetical protein